jgi:hypothetical protein
MEHSLFLRQYKYEILDEVTLQPTLLAYFDFESGGFQLEGDSWFINANNRIKNSRLHKNTTRLLIDANMKPEIPAGPNDNLNNELLLFLHGSFYNGRRQYRCSGLLRLNRKWQNNKAQWMIYCNLIDNNLDFFELKLTLPVFTSLTQTAGNN